MIDWTINFIRLIARFVPGDGFGCKPLIINNKKRCVGGLCRKCNLRVQNLRYDKTSLRSSAKYFTYGILLLRFNLGFSGFMNT